jgi:hypothetical protein
MAGIAARPLAECRGCHASIVWITMRETGAAMPCDPTVIVERLDETAGKAASNVTLITEDGLLVKGRRVEDLHAGIEVRAVAGRIPHWQNCPAAQASRRKSPA